MDVGEKLVELLYEADRACSNKPCTTCKYQDKKFFCKIHYYIDHLIANGVTVQKWIPVTERLPEEECRCLVIDAAGDIEMDCYDGKGRFVLDRSGAVQHPSH